MTPTTTHRIKSLMCTYPQTGKAQAGNYNMRHPLPKILSQCLSLKPICEKSLASGERRLPRPAKALSLKRKSAASYADPIGTCRVKLCCRQSSRSTGPIYIGRHKTKTASSSDLQDAGQELWVQGLFPRCGKISRTNNVCAFFSNTACFDMA